MRKMKMLQSIVHAVPLLLAVAQIDVRLLVPVVGLVGRVGSSGSSSGGGGGSSGTPRSFLRSLGVLLHVFRQVRLLRVRFAAELADVRLEVFRLLVLGYVLEERRLVLEALVARVALVRLVRLVGSRMRLQIAQLGERLGALRMAALVRLVAGVRADVLLQVTQLGELALADLAAVRLDAHVDARVLRQVRAVGERLGALRALVRLRLAHVDLRVQLQVRFRSEYLRVSVSDREREIASDATA